MTSQKLAFLALRDRDCSITWKDAGYSSSEAAAEAMVGDGEDEETRLAAIALVAACLRREAAHIHGSAAGTRDCEARLRDVLSGREDFAWVWPLDGAREEFLGAIGIEALCAELGIPSDAWEDVRDVWGDAFDTAYRDAYGAYCAKVAES